MKTKRIWITVLSVLLVITGVALVYANVQKDYLDQQTERRDELIQEKNDITAELFTVENNIVDYCEKNNLTCGFVEGEYEKIHAMVDKSDDRKPVGLTKVEASEEVAQRFIPGGKQIPSEITGNTKAKRFTNFVRYFARGFDESVFVQARNRYGVKEEVLACIAWSDSDFGNANKSENNIMNYGNNDRGDVSHHEGVLQSVMAAAHGLAEGKYLSTNTLIGELSQGGRDYLGLPGCAEQGVYCYATSEENWRRNVNNCLTFIEGEKKDWDRMKFRK